MSSYNTLGDDMKLLLNIVKKLCIGIFTIYSINVLFSSINMVIPMNIFTISMSSFFGIFGVIAVIVIKFLI